MVKPLPSALLAVITLFVFPMIAISAASLFKRRQAG